MAAVQYKSELLAIAQLNVSYYFAIDCRSFTNARSNLIVLGKVFKSRCIGTCIYCQSRTYVYLLCNYITNTVWTVILLSTWNFGECIWSTCFRQPWKGKFQKPRVTPRHWTMDRALATDVPFPREDPRYRIYPFCVLPDASRERISKPF